MKAQTSSFEKIEYSKLINIAFYLSMIWVLTPLLIMLLNFAGVYSLYVNDIWKDILFLVGLLGLAIGLIYVYKLCEDKKNVKVASKLYAFLPLLILTAYLVWCLVCSLLSIDTKVSFNGNDFLHEGYFTYICYAGFFFVGLILTYDIRKLKIIGNTLLGIASIMSFFSMINNGLSQKLFYSPFLSTTTEYQAVFYNTNHFGYYLLIAILINFFLFLYEEDKKKSLLYIPVYIFLFNMLILNDTMGDYLALFITLVFVIIWKFINKEDRKLKASVFLILFVVMSLLSALYTPKVYLNVVSMFGDVEILNRFFGGKVTEEAISTIGSSRGVLWAYALKFIKKSPIVGYGLETGYALYSSVGIQEWRPHNIFIQIAMFTGIPGLLMYLSAYAIGAIRMIKTRKTISNLATASGFIVVGYLMSAFFGLSLFYTSPYFFIIFGICCSGCLKDINVLEVGNEKVKE